jgi:hypothetical protein
MVILLQVDPIFGDELETIYKGYYETKELLSLHGLQFPMLDIIVGYAI